MGPSNFVKHFTLYDQRELETERDIEQAHKRLAALYPDAIWRHSRATDSGHTTFIAFHAVVGLVAYAELDIDILGLWVHPMTDASVSLYRLAALLFAGEIGGRLQRYATKGSLLGLAPTTALCIRFVESIGGE